MKKRVAVIVQSSRGYGRGILSGIASYAQSHRTWSIFHDERVLDDSIPDWLAEWRGEGLIAGIENRALVDYINSTGVPTVDLHGRFDIPRVPAIRPDHENAVNLAYRHLREQGFRRIVYCGFKGIRYSEHRESILKELAARDGVEVIAFDSPFPHAEHTSAFEADAFLDQESLATWLSKIESPFGVMACNDVRGSQVLNALRTCNLTVPDEVGVIGADNDSCVCGLCDPPLTSVDLNTIRIGFQAAQTLDLIMEGRQPDFSVLNVEPAGVVTRQSTDLMVIEDEDISLALRFIHDNASRGITVDEVVAKVALSRSTLERRFTRLVGRSVKAEINRVRLMHVKDLLANSHYSLEKIAGMVGFATSEYMITFFKKAVGCTPGEYRNEHRLVTP